MARYLVTGGAGFIGTNLVKELMAEGHEVIVLDNYAGGRKLERELSGATYLEGDVRHAEDIDKVFEKKIDGIFHLAALPRVTFSVEHPEETHDVNVNGTLQILMAAKRHRVKRVIFSSSSSVYGDQEVFPLKEEFQPLPVSPYALQKYIGEQYCRMFSLLFGVETVSLRYFNVYGPYFDPDGPYALVVGKFLKQIKNGEPMTVCGDGEYYRDYTHVKDVAKANIKAMTCLNVGKGEVFNIGNGQPFSVNELVKLIGGESIYIPERPGDVRRTDADTTKSKTILGWEPSITFQDGVNELKKDWNIR